MTKLMRSAACVLLLSLASTAHAQLAASGNTLSVTTANAIAAFTNADLVAFRNALTSEDYLRNASPGNLTYVENTNGGPGLQWSAWSIGTEAGTGLPLATISGVGGTRTFTLTVKIDPVSQEIVIRPSASLAGTGMRGAGWVIAGLDVDAGHLIVPAMTGMVIDKSHPAIAAYLEYPNTWHAQMIVYEAAAGSALVYSTDAQLYAKSLRISTRGSSTIDVGIHTQAVAPWSTATAVPTIEWRLKAYTGNWRVAAQTYKDWLTTNRPPVSNANHPWVANIRNIVGVSTTDASLLTSLAAQLAPSQTLLYMIDWRSVSYNYNYPDYTPKAGVAAFIATAHSLGFKVMLHTDYIGVSPGNGDYAAMQPYQVKSPDTLQPIGWRWDWPVSEPTRFAYISPAASAFRSLWIARVSAAVNALNPDGLHLDISAPTYNDGNGLIEGRTYAQGSVQFHQDIINAFPNLALAGEGENDALYRFHSFAQAWYYQMPAPGHPIASFLFSPQVMYYGHLGQPKADNPAFKSDVMELERRAIRPRLELDGAGDVDQANPDVARLFGMARSWQTHNYQPAWSADWTGAVVRYLGQDATTAAFTDTGGVASLTAAGSTLFMLSHDATQATTSTSYIANWPAFDNTTLYGLDASKLYFLDAVARPLMTHVTALPDGTRLGPATMAGNGFLSIDMARPATSTFDFVNGLTIGRTGMRYQGTDVPVANGGFVGNGWTTAAGTARYGLVLNPPWQAQRGAEVWAEYTTALPVGARLSFGVAIDDFNTCTDGVTARITANGFELWRLNIGRDGWHDVTLDLGAWAGNTVNLRFITNPGAAGNPDCDRTLWSPLVVTANPASTPAITVPIALANGATVAGFDGPGTLATSGSTATVANMPVPGTFTLFTQTGAAVANGTNLATLPLQAWLSGREELPKLGSIYGSGTLGNAIVGGVQKAQAIWAHPPYNGQTTLSWALKLPDAGALRLGMSVGLGDGALSSDGVEFQVRVNGITYWRLLTAATQWTPASLDLSRWRGQNIVLQLVTDSQASNDYDWAWWADLIFSSSAGTCSYSVPPGLNVVAGGGAANVAVTATSGCPWSATSSVPWITFNPGSGSGSGTATVLVTSNPVGPRSGTITIAGQAVTVNQSAGIAVAPPSVTTAAAVSVGARAATLAGWANANGLATVGFFEYGTTTGYGSATPMLGLGGGTVNVPIGAGALAGLACGTLYHFRAVAFNQLAVVRGNDVTFTTASCPLSPEDLVADFGAQYGVWVRDGVTSAWTQLHPLTAKSIVTGDLDGNGLDEVVIDFGAQYGIWVRMNNASWVQLHPLTAVRMATGDLDGNGRAELVVDFGAQYGTWVWQNNTSWSQLHPLSTNNIVLADLDGNGRKDAVIDFPNYGVWAWMNNTSWVQLHALNTRQLTVGDLDGNGQEDLVLDFQGYGLWSYRNNGSWLQLHPLNTTHLAAGDVDGNGQADIVVDFGATYGIWLLANGSNWTQLHAATSTGIVTADIDRNGRADIVIDFAAFGLWEFANNASWVQLHPLAPARIASGHVNP